MSLSAGDRLGPYEAIGLIGAGGMGEVYKGRDTRLDRLVAIKVLPAAWSQDPDRRARFSREARAIAALSHPNICAIHDVGHQDGVDFLILEYLDGETLAALLKRTSQLPLHETQRIATQIADALVAAHRAGIVHRDLKPGNVMLTKTGVKVLDFGLAKLSAVDQDAPDAGTRADTAPLLTSVGGIVGTLPYMAPEQVEGGRGDARSDLFAFWCDCLRDGDRPTGIRGCVAGEHYRSHPRTNSTADHGGTTSDAARIRATRTQVPGEGPRSAVAKRQRCCR